VLTELWKTIGGENARLFPISASTFATHNDRIFLYMLTVSAVSVVGIACAIAFFLIKYRHRSGNEVAREVKTSYTLEIAWTVIPFAFVLVAFFWGAHNYLDMLTPRRQAENIFVVGKQWMWKIEHENGAAEINHLHVPVGRDVNLIMISQDVIHSFFIPDFRVKYDVLPGRYSRVWFRATEPGTYLLLCTQYCGVDHALMGGTVEAMTELDYRNWLESSRAKLGMEDLPEKRGEHIFNTRGCASCHNTNVRGGQGIAPTLLGRFFNGDEDYIRQSILRPSARVKPGYPDVMPTFAGKLKEEEIMDLIAYLKSGSKRKDVAND
jgi:cytochrome c oxidase subunit 2